MVRRKATKRNRKNMVGPMRQRLRQLARATSHELRAVTCPADPPMTKAYTEITTILPIYVKTTSDSSNFSPSTDTSDSSFFCAYSKDSGIANCTATIAQLFSAWKQYVGFDTQSARTYDVALHKVCYWGSSTPGAARCEIGLIVDVGGSTTSVQARDVGGMASRARVAVSVPPTVWTICTSTTKVVAVFPDIAGNAAHSGNWTPADKEIIGMVHVTMTVRAENGNSLSSTVTGARAPGGAARRR